MTMAYRMTLTESVILTVIFLSQSDTSAKVLKISVMYRAGNLMPQESISKMQSRRSVRTSLQILKTKEKNYDLKSKIQIQQTYRHK